MSGEAQTRKPAPFWWVRWVPAAILILGLIVLICWIGQSVLVPLLASFALTFMLEPLVDWYQRRGRSRNTAVLLAMATACGATLLLILFLLPSIIGQARESIENVPHAVQASGERLKGVVEYARTHMSSEMLARVNTWINDLQNDPSAITRPIGNWLSSGLLGIVNLGASALGLLIVPFFVYYLLLDLNVVREAIDRRFPERHRGAGARLFDEIGDAVRGYVRGRFLVALAMAVFYALGLFLLGVPLWAGIGLIAGLVGIIPYLGVLIGVLLALGFAALNGAGWGTLTGVVLVFVAAQFLEDYVLTPRLIGDRLDLHPMLVFIALIIAGDLFGLLGLVLAIPALAVIKVLIRFFDHIYMNSDFYKGVGYEDTFENEDSFDRAVEETVSDVHQDLDKARQDSIREQISGTVAES